MTPQRAACAAAWGDFFSARCPNVALTLSYNPMRPGGTASPTYRMTEYGECLPGPVSSRPDARVANYLPVMRYIPLEQVHQDMDWLHRKMDRKLFGTRFHKLPSGERSSFVGCVEKAASNIHVHLAWTMPDNRVDKFTEIVTDAWLAKNRSNSIRVTLIRDSGWGAYMAKEQWGAAFEGDAALFVASRPAHP